MAILFGFNEDTASDRENDYEDVPQIGYWCRREQHDRCGDPNCDDSCHDEPEE